MPQSFNINDHDLIEYTRKLDKLHRSALPVTIRQTLNDVAFEAKKIDIPNEFNDEFIVRRPTFIKSHSFANKSANTFNINEMESSAGIIKGKSLAGDQLKKQEEGGFIINRAIPTLETRGNDRRRRQQARYYYRKYKNIPTGHNPSQKGKRVKQRPKKTFIKTKDRVMMVEKGGEWTTLYYIDRDVVIKKNAFIVPAGVRTSKKIARLYGQRARKRFARTIT